MDRTHAEDTRFKRSDRPVAREALRGTSAGLLGQWPNLAAASDNEGRGHDRMAGGTLVSLESCEQSLDGEPADLVRMLRDYCDTGFDQIGKRKVVEAYKGDRLLALLFTQGMERTNSDQVLRAEDRSGWLVGLQEACKRRLRCGRVVKLSDHRS